MSLWPLGVIQSGIDTGRECKNCGNIENLEVVNNLKEGNSQIVVETHNCHACGSTYGAHEVHILME